MKMIKYQIKENKPYPNNEMPVIFYQNALESIFSQTNYSAEEVLSFLETHGYANGWVNGILTKHHFHSNTHEVLACISGSANVQLGGPEKEVITFNKGDIIFLPAGTAHKKIESSDNFMIVGAYPNGASYDMFYGKAAEYEQVKENARNVETPRIDPVSGQMFKF